MDCDCITMNLILIDLNWTIFLKCLEMIFVIRCYMNKTEWNWNPLESVLFLPSIVMCSPKGNKILFSYIPEYQNAGVLHQIKYLPSSTTWFLLWGVQPREKQLSTCNVWNSPHNNPWRELIVYQLMRLVQLQWLLYIRVNKYWIFFFSSGMFSEQW